MRKFISRASSAAIIFGLIACGSGGGDIPDIAGNYVCNAGCSGACNFDPNLSIIQDGENIIVEFASGTAVGTVDDSGTLNYNNSDGDCQGQFVQGTIVANCELNGVSCQQVTFKR